MTEFETYCTGITLILYSWCSFLLTIAVGCYLYYTYILYCNRKYQLRLESIFKGILGFDLAFLSVALIKEVLERTDNTASNNILNNILTNVRNIQDNYNNSNSNSNSSNENIRSNYFEVNNTNNDNDIGMG